MATVNIQSATLRKNDDFNVLVLDAAGKTLAYFNISVDKDGKIDFTYTQDKLNRIKFICINGEE